MGEPVPRELFDRVFRQLDEQDARARRRQEEIAREIAKGEVRDDRIERQYAELRNDTGRIADRLKGSEAIFVGAMSEINLSIQRNNERLDDTGEEIRANTRAVLSVLDRLEPGTS